MLSSAGTFGFMKLLRDPLSVFLLLGALIFLGNSLLTSFDDAGTNSIDVTTEVKRRLEDQWLVQMGSPPSAEEMASLVDQWIREEIYYREAMALGLDRNDTIIRRRLAQKLSFLTEDIVDAEQPGEGELRALYAASSDEFLEPERFSFEHVYFSAERRVDARGDAQLALTEGSAQGDPFILQLHYTGITAEEISNLVGATFADALSNMRADAALWQGPVESSFGWHLLRLTQREPARVQTYEDVVSELSKRLIQQRRTDANEALFEQLRARYQVRDLTVESDG